MTNKNCGEGGEMVKKKSVSPKKLSNSCEELPQLNSKLDSLPSPKFYHVHLVKCEHF